MASVLANHVNQSFNNSTSGIQSGIADLQRSGRYYVTHELNKEINQINNGVNHMKLDSDFINGSKQWGERFDGQALNAEKTESANLINQSTGVVNECRNNFPVDSVNKLQPNQIREMHEWANRSLDGVKQNLDPYATSAQSRINQFCDKIGVTDRYTGYRHNLTRGSRDPTKLGMSWLKPNTANPYQTKISSGHRLDQPGTTYLPASLPKRRFGSPPQCSETVNPIRNTMSAPTQPQTKSLQERCGINTVFPGITEYMKRYNTKHADDRVKGFLINPVPDLSIYGRPSASVVWTPNHTEYQTRYEWPECSKIVKKPWIRK